MPFTIPQITLYQTPSRFSPVYAPNWFAFTASYGSATDITLIATVNVLRQNIQAPTLQESVGRFKVPIRENNRFTFDPAQVLKSYVTYPYDTGDKIYYGSGEAMYVNELAGFGSQWYAGSPTSSFPTIAPEQDGIVKYNVRYGLDYNPNIRFNIVTAVGGPGPDGIYRDYTRYVCGTTSNIFAVPGDIININVDSNLFSYYNGKATVTACYYFLGVQYVETWQQYNATLGAITQFVSGTINSVEHIYGTSSVFYAYNGTRQYEEKDVNFDNIYYLKQFSYGTTSSNFPSTSTASNYRFMNDYGYDSAHAIPIRPGQSERTRFLVDFYDRTTSALHYDMITYNSAGATVSSRTSPILTTPGGPFYPYKCFTLQLFDPSSSIIDGYKYLFRLRNNGNTTSGKIEIWYKGVNTCSQYENYRIKFLNRQGTWAYWNFNKDNKQTTNIKRTEYKTPFQFDQTMFTVPKGGTTMVSSPYSLSKLRGQNILSISATETFTLNSDWITEDESTYLGQLLTSPQVFIFYDDYTLTDGTKVKGVNIPIIITDNSYTYKTVNRDRLFNLTINYKYAYDSNLQNP